MLFPGPTENAVAFAATGVTRGTVYSVKGHQLVRETEPWPFSTAKAVVVIDAASPAPSAVIVISIIPKGSVAFLSPVLFESDVFPCTLAYFF